MASKILNFCEKLIEPDFKYVSVIFSTRLCVLGLLPEPELWSMHHPCWRGLVCQVASDP